MGSGKQKNDRWYQGTIRDVFGHRFVLATDGGSILANIGAHAPKNLKLKTGAKVSIAGRQMPTEIKVRLLQNGKGAMIAVRKHRANHRRNREKDIESAARAALDAGYMVEGDPKRRSNHFELKTIRDGRRYKLYIMPNGDIRKERPLEQ
jgi:hypothetical protein